MIQFIKSIFNGVDRQYLVKSYIISIALTIGVIAYGDENAISVIIFFVVSGILFPFSSIVWDDLANTLMKGNFIILPFPWVLIWKLVKIAFLYFVSILIAPLGVLYIYIANRV